MKYTANLIILSLLESDHYNPTNPYAATKAAAELLINSYIKSYNINIIIS